MKRFLFYTTNFLVIFTFTFGFFSKILGQSGNWQTITNKSSIGDITIKDNLLICATNGGVLIFDRNNEEYVGSFTNTENLSHNHPIQVEIDDNNNLWFGLQNGDLNQFNINENKWELFKDFDRLSIHDMELHGDSLFIALNIGVSVFILSKQEAKETYKKMGNIPVEIDAFDALVEWPLIYVATDFGISVADLRQINLKAPQSWDNLTTLDGLASNKVNAIESFNGDIFISTERGVQKLKNGEIQAVYSSILGIAVAAFSKNENELYAAVNKFVYKYDPDLDRWDRQLTLNDLITTFVVDENGDLWLGAEKKGLIKWEKNLDEIDYFISDGPAGNNFADLFFDSEGKLWCASASQSGNGVYAFNGEKWTNFTKSNGDLPGDESVTVIEDQNKNIWVGSWGKGVYKFGSNNQIDVFNETTGHLSGIPQDLSFVVVNEIAIDQDGTLWMGNFSAFNGIKLVAVTTDGQWVKFGLEDGILSANPISIAIDQLNRKWVGTDGGGIYVYDDNRTPIDKSDDSVAILNRSLGLSSNIIKAVAIDEFNVVWIATGEGLEYYQNGEVRQQFGLITNEINTIAIDPVGNKWVGTSSGFSILGRDDFRWTHYTTENSPLVSSNVVSFAFNRKTGTSFIATSNGLSIFQTLFVEPHETLEQLTLYPNPVMIGTSETNVIVEGLCRNCDLNIYTSSGFLIRKLVTASKGGRAIWDGRNNEGLLVASGIYLAVAVDPDGIAKSGKIAVINQ